MSSQCDQFSPAETVTVYSHKGGSHSISNSSLVTICQDVLARGLPFRFAAPGFSMSPFIKDRDVITMIPYQRLSCRTGMIVAFVRPETRQLVVHRIVAAKSTSWWIRGDNCLEDDGIIPHDAIVGQVIRIERGGKDVSLGLGPERILIAMFSRIGLLRYVLYPLGMIQSVLRKIS